MRDILQTARKRDLDPDYVIEQFLIESPLSFIEGSNFAIAASRDDSEIIRMIYLCIQKYREPFVESIASIGAGHAIFQAIVGVTEIESFNEKKKLDLSHVRVIFDTPLIMNILGHSGRDFVASAKELHALCRSTGATPCIFPHSIRECTSIIDGARKNLENDRSPFGPIKSEIDEKNLTADNLLMFTLDIEDRIAFYFDTLPEEDYTVEDYGIDESRLRTLVETYAKQDPEPREFDVRSLSATHKLREGQAFRYLEDTNYIFATTTKSIVDSARVFFRTHFSDIPNDQHIVPIAISASYLSMRLWMKTGTTRRKMPIRQIVGHVLGNTRVDRETRTRFADFLKRNKDSGKISDEEWLAARMSRLVEKIIFSKGGRFTDEFTESNVLQTFLAARRQKDAEREQFSTEQNEKISEQYQELKSIRMQIQDMDALEQVAARDDDLTSGERTPLIHQIEQQADVIAQQKQQIETLIAQQKGLVPVIERNINRILFGVCLIGVFVLLSLTLFGNMVGQILGDPAKLLAINTISVAGGLMTFGSFLFKKSWRYWLAHQIAGLIED